MLSAVAAAVATAGFLFLRTAAASDFMFSTAAFCFCLAVQHRSAYSMGALDAEEDANSSQATALRLLS